MNKEILKKNIIKCERVIKTKEYGIIKKWECGKPAIAIDSHKRFICSSHLLKRIKKYPNTKYTLLEVAEHIIKQCLKHIRRLTNE